MALPVRGGAKGIPVTATGTTVLVLGAGATRAEWQGRRKRSAVAPPVDRDFCRVLFELDGLPNVRGELKGRLERLVGSSDLFEESMEDVFATVFLDLMRDVPATDMGDEEFREHPNTLFHDLVMGLNAAIARTTNELAGDGREGSTHRVLRGLRARCQELVVVSFNYDLVAESALDALAAEGLAAWSMPSTYGAAFLRTVTTQRGGAYEARFATTIEPTSSLPLLKLHGSANWITYAPFGDVRLDQASKQILHAAGPKSMQLPNFAHHFAFPADREVYCATNRLLPQVPEFTHDEKRGFVAHWPLVIPPVFEKGELLRGWLAPVWTEAGNALQRADHVVLWGYSMPLADHRTTAMLRRSLGGRSPAPRVSVINPDAAVASSVLSRVRLSQIEQFRTEDHFLAAL